MAADKSSFRETKAFDLLAASPLIVWYAFAIAGIAIHDVRPIFEPAFEWNLKSRLALISQLVTALFIGLQLVLFLIRRLPVAKAPGLVPRLAAIVGANLTFAFLALPRASLAPSIEVLSTVIVLFGTLASITAAFRLGRSFSILPQARLFVATGPYRFVRHPLYLAEQIATWGVMLQYAQPWSLLIALASFAAQFPRMYFEEQVLRQTYADYASYEARTKRLIPWLY